MPGEHARLSASGAKRWLMCPRSVALEEKFPEPESEFAAEGTKAHALAEKLLSIFRKTGRREFTPDELGSDNDMAANVMSYVTYVIDLYDAAMLQRRDTFLYIEQKLDYSKYVPQGFGTSDVVIISGNNITVIDLKYGKGVVVSAWENPQSRLYGLGALEENGWIYDLKTIEMHIVQPRLERISVEHLAVEDLIKWGTEEVIPKAKLAMENKGEFVPGEHCQFCKANAICKARALKCLKAIEAILTKEGS